MMKSENKKRDGGLRAAGNLFEHPTHVVHDGRVVSHICVHSECTRPPSEAQDHEKHAVGSTAIEVVKREVIWKWIVSWRPLLPRSRLDSAPPVENRCAKCLRIHVVTTGVISRPLLELANLGGPVARRKS